MLLCPKGVFRWRVCGFKPPEIKLVWIWGFPLILGLFLYGCTVSVLDCQSRDSRLTIPPRAEIWFEISVPSDLTNSAMMSTLIVHCQWEDETVGKRTGHPPSCRGYEMKSLTVHTNGCPRASLRDCSPLVLLCVFRLSLQGRIHWRGV